jgi:hypothetical protein
MRLCFLGFLRGEIAVKRFQGVARHHGEVLSSRAIAENGNEKSRKSRLLSH